MNANINTNALEPATYFELNGNLIYMFTKKFLFLFFALKSKEQMS